MLGIALDVFDDSVCTDAFLKCSLQSERQTVVIQNSVFQTPSDTHRVVRNGCKRLTQFVGDKIRHLSDNACFFELFIASLCKFLLLMHFIEFTRSALHETFGEDTVEHQSDENHKP